MKVGGDFRIQRGIKSRCPNFRFLLVFVTLLAFAPRAAAQARYIPVYTEPKWFTFRISEVSAGVYAEGVSDESSFKNSGSTVSHEHIFLGPSLGFNASGSIYHPNLLTYAINSEGAFGWNHDTFNSTGTSFSRNELDYLGRFSASADLLENKPFRATLFANYDHTFRDNDFFSRVTVDSWRYGERASFQVGAFRFSVDYSHRDETSTSPFPVINVASVTNIVSGTNVVTLRTNQSTLDQQTISHEDTVTAGVRNERASGGTDLNYSWDRYTRVDVGRLGEGNDHAISLADNERFGPLDIYKLNSSASYYRRDSSAEASDEVMANLNFSAEHRPKLTSFYELNYDHFSTGGFTSDAYSGQAALQHQLYDSLISTLILRGADFETSDSATTTSIRRYGGGFSESYIKRVSDDNRLRISNTLLVEHTDQEIATQNLVAIKNERHTFSQGGGPPDSFSLNLPNAISSTIIVTDDQNSQPAYLENFDYRVMQNGSITFIERLTGSRIGTNQVVLVDYDAQPSPSGSYSTLSESFEVRLELWQNLVGIYGRVNLSLNDAAADLRVQNVNAYTIGSDLNYKWLRAGAEYQIYNSTISDYQSARVFQSLTFRPDEASTLGLDFSEVWINYVSAHRQEEDFQFITRYHRGLTHRLGLNTDAGVSMRRGNGVDQILAAVRPSIKYVIGKTTIDAGYDYEYELYLNSEERQKHMFFFRLKRYF
jgi:hypothetical protein